MVYPSGTNKIRANFSTTEPIMKVENFSDTSMHDEDAILQFIGTLIKEIQELKVDNRKLRRLLDFPGANVSSRSTRVVPTVDRGNQGMKHYCGKDRTKCTDGSSKASLNVKQVESEGKLMCKYFQRGFCRYGRNCKFWHKAAAFISRG